MPDRPSVKVYPLVEFVACRQPAAVLRATVRSAPDRLDITFSMCHPAEVQSSVLGWPRALSLHPDLDERKS